MSSSYPPITTPTMIPPSDPCSDGYMSGRSEVLWNLPNTYQDILSIIGSYQNLTWSGNPPDTVTLNGSDNTVGTARSYDLDGAQVTETISVYQKPVDGPYVEIHSVAPLTVPSAGNVSFYAAFDGTTVTPICDGRATAWNFTASFCATNVSAAMSVLDMLHTNDVMMVGKMLGGDGSNETSCAAVGAGNASITPTATPTLTTPGMGTATQSSMAGQVTTSFGASQKLYGGMRATIALVECLALALFLY